MKRLDLNCCACTARILGCAAWYLLILSALSLVTMPITEHLWTWDRFFQTGRDFELSTLMVLMILCLVLVLSKQCKRSIDLLMSLLQILALHLAGLIVPAACLPGIGAAFDPEPFNVIRRLRIFQLQI